MESKQRIIVGVNIHNRQNNAPDVQKIFTDYGCQIKTRIGLHEVDNNLCSTAGLILLELFGDDQKCLELCDRLAAHEGVEVQKMVFSRF